MTDRLAGISMFVRVVEAGSFALAGQRLGLSRSAVGKAIARLEDRLGVRLFHRTTRSQSLTAEGQGFYERCLRALAELEAAEQALEEGRQAPSGRLRVTMPVLLGRLCAAPILVSLATRHAQLRLELGFSDQVQDLVEERIDLAVRIGPLGDRSDLTARRLGSFAMYPCASPDYVAARGRPTRLADLPGHALLPYGRDGRSLAWAFTRPDGSLQRVEVAGRMLLNDLEALADAAAAGAGIAFLPCWLIGERVRAGRLDLLPMELPASGGDVFAVWPQARHLPSKVRAAIDALAAEMPRVLA